MANNQVVGVQRRSSNASNASIASGGSGASQASVRSNASSGNRANVVNRQSIQLVPQSVRINDAMRFAGITRADQFLLSLKSPEGITYRPDSLLNVWERGHWKSNTADGMKLQQGKLPLFHHATPENYDIDIPSQGAKLHFTKKQSGKGFGPVVGKSHKLFFRRSRLILEKLKFSVNGANSVTLNHDELPKLACMNLGYKNSRNKQRHLQGFQRLVAREMSSVLENGQNSLIDILTGRVNTCNVKTLEAIHANLLVRAKTETGRNERGHCIYMEDVEGRLENAISSNIDLDGNTRHNVFRKIPLSMGGLKGKSGHIHMATTPCGTVVLVKNYEGNIPSLISRADLGASIRQALDDGSIDSRNRDLKLEILECVSELETVLDNKAGSVLVTSLMGHLRTMLIENATDPAMKLTIERFLKLCLYGHATQSITRDLVPYHCTTYTDKNEDILSDRSYSAGYRDGYADGYDDGRDTGSETRSYSGSETGSDARSYSGSEIGGETRYYRRHYAESDAGSELGSDTGSDRSERRDSRYVSSVYRPNLSSDPNASFGPPTVDMTALGGRGIYHPERKRETLDLSADRELDFNAQAGFGEYVPVMDRNRRTSVHTVSSEGSSSSGSSGRSGQRRLDNLYFNYYTYGNGSGEKNCHCGVIVGEPLFSTKKWPFMKSNMQRRGTIVEGSERSSRREGSERGSGKRGSERGSERRGSERGSERRGSERGSERRGSERGSADRDSRKEASERGSAERSSRREASERGSAERSSRREASERGSAERGSRREASERGSAERSSRREGSERGSADRDSRREASERGSEKSSFEKVEEWLLATEEFRVPGSVSNGSVASGREETRESRPPQSPQPQRFRTELDIIIGGNGLVSVDQRPLPENQDLDPVGSPSRDVILAEQASERGSADRGSSREASERGSERVSLDRQSEKSSVERSEEWLFASAAFRPARSVSSGSEESRREETRASLPPRPALPPRPPQSQMFRSELNFTIRDNRLIPVDGRPLPKNQDLDPANSPPKQVSLVEQLNMQLRAGVQLRPVGNRPLRPRPALPPRPAPKTESALAFSRGRRERQEQGSGNSSDNTREGFNLQGVDLQALRSGLRRTNVLPRPAPAGPGDDDLETILKNAAASLRKTNRS